MFGFFSPHLARFAVLKALIVSVFLFSAGRLLAEEPVPMLDRTIPSTVLKPVFEERSAEVPLSESKTIPKALPRVRGSTLHQAIYPIEQAIALAKAALDDVRPNDAVGYLSQAREPYEYENHVLLYELLGISYAYLDKVDKAVSAFERMLALDSSRVLPYTLSPKVTFLFERARRTSKDRGDSMLDVSWPKDLRTKDTIPVTLEVLSDPLGLFHEATIYYRLRGAGWSRTKSHTLPRGQLATVRLPALGAISQETQVELYVVVTDTRENQVHLIGSETRPRIVNLQYQAPSEWFEKWWVWAAVAGVVAGGVGAAVLLDSDPPSSVGGRFEVP